MGNRTWNVYLSGEIHSDWRERIATGTAEADLPVRLDAPNCVHEDSDDCGVAILGAEPDTFWHDKKGASMNAIRTRTLIADADIVVVRFGEKYRQWNAAFDAGIASALGKALVILHGPEHNHALKEMAEWLKAPVLKTGRRATVSWVRIPPHPPVRIVSVV